ncbi:MAG TPA: MerR family transcriptional regulator [Terriglobales bacterium]|nr:MerR family transcriptional regulator [Acidobacteriaceae bacterium]HKR30281.1 MerR family transcriptional regulator [Terriglobales bacterium]
MEKPLKTQAFAALTGVTVRALHHYDRIGLLRPQRSAAGYRLYGKRELERLEQIVALRFIGVPLKQMRPLLDGSELAEALPRQRAVLEEKRRILGEAIRAIEAAERALATGQQPDTAILTKIIEVIEMQNETNWTEKYYGPEAQETVRERQASWTPELQAKSEQDWHTLFRDVEAALDEDPASETAQALGRRWKDLVSGFTGGNAEVAKGLNRLYADRGTWPASAQQQMAAFSNPRVWDFMDHVLNCKQLG